MTGGKRRVCSRVEVWILKEDKSLTVTIDEPEPVDIRWIVGIFVDGWIARILWYANWGYMDTSEYLLGRRERLSS